MKYKNNKSISNRIKLSMAVVLSMTSFSTSAALLQMHEDELLNSCQRLHENPASAEALACATYISGFLDGALATDRENANELKKAEQSGFMERALRTRLGDRDSEDSYLHFCIPSSKGRADVVEQLAPHLSEKVNSYPALKRLIYQGLKTEFPCKTMPK